MLEVDDRGVAPKHNTTPQIFRAVAPYVLFGLVMLVLVMLMPSLATWLPGVLLKP